VVAGKKSKRNGNKGTIEVAYAQFIMADIIEQKKKCHFLHQDGVGGIERTSYRMIIIDDIDQLSDQWFKIKAGIPSAASFDKIITSKGAPSTQRKKYLYQLAGEAIIGTKTETYTNSAMQRGIELESEARDLFQMINGVDVKQVGLCFPDQQKKYSCSPDGLLPGSGLELKCPLIHTHIDYLLGGKLPTEYIQQVQGSMLVTSFQSWWFCSYYPGLKPFIIQVYRDETFISKLKTELDKFCLELAVIVHKIREV